MEPSSSERPGAPIALLPGRDRAVLPRGSGPVRDEGWLDDRQRPQPERPSRLRLGFDGVGGALLLLATLLAWQRPLRRKVGLYVVLCLLGFPLQPLLASGGVHHRFVGMFHPVNALLLLGLSGSLAYTAWVEARARDHAPEAAAAAVQETNRPPRVDEGC